MKVFKQVLVGMAAAVLLNVSFAADSATQVFRSVDAQGNVVFTDTPREGAKPVDIQAPSSVTPMPVETRNLAPAAGRVQDGEREDPK